jgi:hypothetical protein
VLYVPAAKQRPRVAVRNGGGGSYRVEWINPRNGARSKGSAPVHAGADGTLLLPSPPDDHDWAVLLRR